MKPILYPPEERDFNSNGLGVLSDAISCTVTWEGNGIFDLTMEYPMDGIHFDKITDRCIIMAIPTPYRDPQPFRIVRITKRMDGTAEVYAQHVAYDLAGTPVRAFSAENAASAMASIESNAVTPSGFTFWTNKTTAAQFSMDAPAPIWKILGGSEGSILDVYGGEYEFDRWAVKLHDHLGQDNGVVIRYGKNMTDLEQERNLANLYTGVYPYWKGSDGEIVTCSTEVVPVDGTFDYIKILTLDASAEFQDKPTPEQLKAYTEQYIKINDVGKPRVSITVSHEMLEQTDEYTGLSLLERCSVFDTVTVQFEKLGVDVKAKIASAETDVLLERYISLKVGSVQANIADTIAGQQTELERVPNTSEVQAIADRVTQALLGAKGGSIRWLDTNGDNMPDTLYIADNPDPAKAIKVWRFNYEGWGASSNGYNGPFEMGAALGVGLYADFITAGTLLAALIKTGVIRSTSGNTEYNLDQGYIRSGPSAGTRFEINSNRINWYVEQGGTSYLTGVLYSVYGMSYLGANSQDIVYGWVNSGTPNSWTGMKINNNPSTQALFNTQKVDIQNDLGVGQNLSTRNLSAWGSKERVIKTPYGPLSFAAMESPEPSFCDFGGGTIGDDGTCPICYSQQYEASISPQAVRWIVTPTCEHPVWVERTEYGAVAHGTPGATFDWMCVGVQFDMGGKYADVSESAEPPSYMEEDEDLDSALIEQEQDAQPLDLWEDETELEKEMERDFL